jgi:hypothetical protein
MRARGLTINGMKRAILVFAALLAAHPTRAAAVRLRVTVDPSLDGAGRSANVYRCPEWSGVEQNFPDFALCAELRSIRFRDREVEIGDLPHELLYIFVAVDEPKRAHVKGRRVDLRTSDLQRAEVAFEPATVSGAVMFRGDALAATLEVREISSFGGPAGPPSVLRTSDGGFFEFRRWPGVYRVHVRPDRKDVPEADLAAQIADDDRSVRCDLEVSGTKALFHAVDSESGRPVPAATLSVFDDWNPVEKTTDAGGRATIAGLSPGIYRATVRADGYAPGARDVEVADTLDVQPFTITLNPDRSSRAVRVLAPNCAPVDSVQGFYRYDPRTGQSLRLPCDGGVCRVSEALDFEEPVILHGSMTGLRVVHAGMLRTKSAVALLPSGGPLVVRLRPGHRILGGSLRASVTLAGVELDGPFLDQIAANCSVYSSMVCSDPPAPLTIGALPEGRVEVRIYTFGLDSRGRRLRELVAGPVPVTLPSPPIDIDLP